MFLLKTFPHFLSAHVANKKKQMKSDADKSPADDSREAENEADDESKEDASNSPQVAKANEFENLANLCLKEGK